jgi:hypothetical protein
LSTPPPEQVLLEGGLACSSDETDKYFDSRTMTLDRQPRKQTFVELGCGVGIVKGWGGWV